METLESSKIVISIVTYNSDKVFLCLDRLVAALKDVDTYLVKIFDNHSDAAFIQRLKAYERYSFIEITCSSENRGFGAGHNANLLTAPQRYGIIFNPDIILEKDIMHDLVQLLRQHPECAFLAPKIVNEDGTQQYLMRRRLTVFDYFIRFLPQGSLKRRFDKRLARFECRDIPEDHDSYVRMISGSFMVADLQKYRQIGGFDDRYFMYFEDNDLCLTAEKSGYKILYTPMISVVHLYERGAVKSAHLFRVFLTSMVRFFNKWGWRFF